MTPQHPGELWLQDFKAQCGQRGMRFVSGTGFTVDDVYMTSLRMSAGARRGSDVLRAGWTVAIKPLVLDEILWAAFMPDVDLGGPRKRLNHRVTGAFVVRPLTLGATQIDVPVTDDSGRHLADALDEFVRLRDTFVTQYPDVAGFLDAVRAVNDVRNTQWRLLEILTLVAAGHRDEAAAIADAELAKGEGGPMSSASGQVYELLSLSCKPPEALSAHIASLEPTHVREIVSDTDRASVSDLARARHHGRFLDHLTSFDGTTVFAMILSPVPPGLSPREARDAARDSEEYLQAAGSAEKITLEIRTAGSGRWDGMWVRNVIGRAHSGRAPLDTSLELPRNTVMLTRHEVFDAEEAAAVFDAYYRTGDIGPQYTLRPVEATTADGDRIDIPG